MSRNDDVQKVQIVAKKDHEVRGAVALIGISLLLIVIAVHQEFGDHTPRYRPKPEPSQFLVALPGIAGAVVGAVIVAFLLVRFGPRVYAWLRPRLARR